MKKSKSIIALALAASMMAGVLSLSACSSPAPANNTPAESSEAESNADDPLYASNAGSDEQEQSNKTYDFAMDSDNVVDLGKPATTLNPTTVYNKTTYIPEMFCAEYTMLGSDSTIKAKLDEVGLYKYNEKASTGGGVERQITNLPYYVNCKQYQYVGDKNGTSLLYVMEAKFLTDKGDKTSKKFKLKVNNKSTNANTIELEEIINIKYDDKYEKITAYETAQLKLEYEFSFRGLALTLKKQGKSVTLYTAYSDPKQDTSPRFASIAFIGENSPMIDHISGFYISRNKDGSSSLFQVTFVNGAKEDETSYFAHGQLSDNGLFTFSVPYATETKTYQYVYFYLGYGGLILTNGKTNYKYNVKEDVYKENKLKAVAGDNASGLSTDDQKELIVAQNTILLELEKAFKEKNINASIDQSTGRVSLDSNILFASDSADLSNDGKSNLDKFLDVYTSVLLNGDHKDMVAKIIVEGHTDTNGTHEYNQDLSEKRAKTVADYCIGKVASLKDIIESKGYSYDNPIYNEDGTVNMEASRRVVFRFMLEKKK